MRGATVSCTTTTPFFYDFNPRSSCEERPYRTRQFRRSRHFNPRSSCEERRENLPALLSDRRIFQSTLLMRGATPHDSAASRLDTDFNPRSSCEERPSRCCRVRRPVRYFNPRSSCEERQKLDERATGQIDFNPRSSCEERRVGDGLCFPFDEISIHAPHARSDGVALTRLSTLAEFQSTLLMRGATSRSPHALLFDLFQSTLLMRGATLQLLDAQAAPLAISIHAPHARSDLQTITDSLMGHLDFNPRSSCEERLHKIGISLG